MFEHHKQPLASRHEFTGRMLRFGALAAGILLFSLGIGVLGYHFFEGLPWLDSLLQRVHVTRRDGSDCSTEHDGWKVVRLILCPVRGADHPCGGGRDGHADPAPHPASFSFGDRRQGIKKTRKPAEGVSSAPLPTVTLAWTTAIVDQFPFGYTYG